MPDMTRMQMGANIPLTGTPLRASLRWTPGPGVPDVDLTALLLQAGGTVGADADFVFYNQPVHPSGAVRLVDGALDLDPAAVPASVARVVLAASATGGTFGQVPGLELHLVERDSGAAVAVFPMSASTETAFVCAELYRRDAQWKFRAVGQGYASGLAGLAADFGISAGDSPAPPVTPPPAPVTPPPAPVTPPPAPVTPPPAPVTPPPAPVTPPPAPAAPPVPGGARGALDLDAPWPPR